MPVFEGLLPTKYSEIVLDLLFELVQWLSLAMLHQHTETTLSRFEAATTSLGNQVRVFMAKVCPHFETTDTPREAGARAKCQAVKSTGGASRMSKSRNGKEATTDKRRREFNPNTYKFHTLADYCSTIRCFGTIDNYNTQNVSFISSKRTVVYETCLQSEREHRRLKVYYARTNKNKFTRQCTRLELRERVLRSIRAKEKGRNEQMEPDCNDGTKDTCLSFEQADPLPQTLPQDHTQISRSMQHCVDLWQFVTEWRNDPAFCVSPPFRYREHGIQQPLSGLLSSPKGPPPEECPRSPIHWRRR